MKTALPDRAAKALLRHLGLPTSPAQHRIGMGRQFFDARWYADRYLGGRTDPDEAYQSFLDTGMKAGHFPSALFEALRTPRQTQIPPDHLFRVTSSPILCHVPPGRYLEFYRTHKQLHKDYSTWDEYARRAVLRPCQIQDKLSDRDIRIAAFMDAARKRLAGSLPPPPQDALVSIILTVRGSSAGAAYAVASVIMQSHENWELLVIDASNDRNELEPMVGGFSDTRMRVIRPTRHAGNDAFGVAIKQSCGSVMAYLDDSSRWDPDFLLILLQQMKMQNAKVAYCADLRWDEFDPQSGLGFAFRALQFAPFNRSLLENRPYIPLHSLVHHRTLFETAGEPYAAAEISAAHDFILRVTEVETSVAVPCLLSHSFHSDHLTDDPSSIRKARTKLIERSPWSQPFTTGDGVEHIAFSLSKPSMAARRSKWKNIPVEQVQILIPNYESPRELEICLRSIAEHTLSPYDVLVIDNGSSEETYSALETMASSFERVRLISETSQSGFSFAVNRGINEVIETNQKVLILNNDTLVTPHWLDELLYVFHKHDDAGMVVPRQVLPANNRLIRIHMPGADSGFECDINLSASHDNVVDPEFDRADNLIELNYAPLFCGLLRSETLRAAGCLDSANGPHFLSDWILCDTIRRFLKQRIIYTPHSKVYHLQGVATQTKKLVAKGAQGCAADPKK
jgi:GT2 family glycosyltransferase